MTPPVALCAALVCPLFACVPAFAQQDSPAAVADGLVQVASEDDAKQLLAGGKWKCDAGAEGYLQCIVTHLEPEDTLRFVLIFLVPADCVVDGTWELGLMRREACLKN